MKTLYIALLAVIAAGVIGLTACSDSFSTDGEVSPLADEDDMVHGYVTVGATQEPVGGAWVVVYKREKATDPWIYIDEAQTGEDGHYEFDPLLGDWPAGWGGKVDCTYDESSAQTPFTYPAEGPVRADINLPG